MTKPLAVLLCLWDGWRPSLYGARHVAAVARMLRRYLTMPHAIWLLTDLQPRPAAAEVHCDHVAAAPADPPGLKPLSSINCYRRLRFFDPAYSAQFGAPWLLSMDLDTLVLDDFSADIERVMATGFGFGILRGRYYDLQRQARPYNGGFYLIEAGRHAHVWDTFDGERGPQAVRDTKWRGSDQVWLSLKLPGAPTLGPEHGFYFFEQYLQSSDEEPQAKVINYAGPLKPWTKMSRRETPELWQEWERFAVAGDA